MSRNAQAKARRLLHAKELAISIHATHTRDSGAPYVEHPLGVARIIKRLFGGAYPDAQVVGVLHDTIEMGPEGTFERISEELGPSVAKDVRSLTREPNLTDEERVAWLWDTPRSQNACIAMAADKIHNLSTIPDSWNNERRHGYLLKMRETYHYLAHNNRVPDRLLKIFERKYERVAKQCGVTPLRQQLKEGGWVPFLPWRQAVAYGPK